MTVTDKASLAHSTPSYAAAYNDFLSALDQLESAGASLQAAYHADQANASPAARSIAGQLATARIGGVTSLGELRRVLAPE